MQHDQTEIGGISNELASPFRISDRVDSLEDARDPLECALVAAAVGEHRERAKARIGEQRPRVCVPQVNYVVAEAQRPTLIDARQPAAARFEHDDELLGRVAPGVEALEVRQQPWLDAFGTGVQLELDVDHPRRVANLEH